MTERPLFFSTSPDSRNEDIHHKIRAGCNLCSASHLRLLNDTLVRPQANLALVPDPVRLTQPSRQANFPSVPIMKEAPMPEKYEVPSTKSHPVMPQQIRTQLTDFFKLQHPVVLAGMNQAASSSLAAAVTNAGGMGGFPLLVTTSDASTDRRPFHLGNIEQVSSAVSAIPRNSYKNRSASSRQNCEIPTVPLVLICCYPKWVAMHEKPTRITRTVNYPN